MTEHEPTSQTVSEGDEAYCAACNQSFSLDQMFCPNDGAKLIKLRATPDQLLGRVFDNRYEIRAVLSHGGMGTVYRAWQLSVDREVAIKVIHPKLATVRDVAKRFLREARLASRLSQPNIVNVYDFGQSDDGVLYLVMELLRGRPLSAELKGGQGLPIRRIVAIGAQICDALDAAHGQGIVHRDLKPHNVVVLDDPPGRDLIKVLDFGLAKSLLYDTTSLVTQTDALLGTPLYMPPEQIAGKSSDQRADLYSLGCMLYQMASGHPPFSSDNVNAVLAMHLRTSPPPLPDAVPPALAALIARLMMKAPDDRPATARLVHAALSAITSDGSSPLLLPPPSHRDPSDSRSGNPRAAARNWRAMVAAFGASIAVGGLVAALWSMEFRSNPGITTIPRADAASGPPVHSPALSVDAAAAPPIDAAPPPVDATRPFDARPRKRDIAGPSPATKSFGELTRTGPGRSTKRPTPAGNAKPPNPDRAGTDKPPVRDAGLPDIPLLPTRR